MEELRKKLYHCIRLYGIESIEALNVSRELDILVAKEQYNSLKIRKNQYSTLLV